VPELDVASVPQGYLGEALFEHPLFLEIKASHNTLGSQADFLQLHLQVEKVFRLAEKWHLLLRQEFGMTLVSDFNELPAVYRFFAGGTNSVRGFAYNELSPLEQTCALNSSGQIIKTASGSCQGDPGNGIKTGGKDVVTGTVEVIRTLPKNLGVAGFFDYGNALNSFTHRNCVPDGTAPQGEPQPQVCQPYIQYSVGIGLRVLLPVMTLGVDLAQPLSVSGGPRLDITFSAKL
jgi:translocation and assembly module TamA